MRAANKSGIARARQNIWLQLVFSVAPGPGAAAPGIGSQLPAPGARANNQVSRARAHGREGPGPLDFFSRLCLLYGKTTQILQAGLQEIDRWAASLGRL